MPWRYLGHSDNLASTLTLTQCDPPFEKSWLRPWMLHQLSRLVGIYLIIRFVAGRCVCTPGLSYITINNYQPRNDRTSDDVRFEFKSTQSSGMIMFLKGRYRDSLYVAYEDSRVFIVHIDLGTGNTASRTWSPRPFAGFISSSNTFWHTQLPVCGSPSSSRKICLSGTTATCK